MKKDSQYYPLFVMLSDSNAPSITSKEQAKKNRKQIDFYKVKSIELYPFYKNISTIASNYDKEY